MQTQDQDSKGIVFSFRSLTIRVDLSSFLFYVYRGEKMIDPVRGCFSTKDEAVVWIMQNLERDKEFANYKEEAPIKPVLTKDGFDLSPYPIKPKQEQDAADLIAAGFGDGMEIESEYEHDRREFKGQQEAKERAAKYQTIIINRGSEFGALDGVFTPNKTLYAIVNKALKEGKANIVVDTESTLVYHVTAG